MYPILFSFVLAALLSTILLLPVGRFAEKGKGKRRLLSAAAGASIAYIFVKLLPEIETAGMILQNEWGHLLPYQGSYGVNLGMMFGFIFFYSLNGILPVKSDSCRTDLGSTVFWGHIAGYGGYIALIGYLLVSPIEDKDGISVFYVLSMSFHFLLITFALRDVHGVKFDQVGRFCLFGACIAGWVFGGLYHVLEVILIPLFGFVCGGVIAITGIVELPKGDEGRIVPFISGAIGYAVLLVLNG